jgi:hypothetical protein
MTPWGPPERIAAINKNDALAMLVMRKGIAVRAAYPSGRGRHIPRALIFRKLQFWPRPPRGGRVVDVTGYPVAERLTMSHRSIQFSNFDDNLNILESIRGHLRLQRCQFVIRGSLFIGGIVMAKNARGRKLVRWSKVDVKDLKGHSRSKTSVAKVARVMKRSPGAIRQKAASLGLPMGHSR